MTRITNLFQFQRPRVTIPVAGERDGKVRKKAGNYWYPTEKNPFVN